MAWYVWVGIGLVLFFGFLGWAMCRVGGMADDAAGEPLYVPADWDWPSDRSEVRHGGLGR